jgi:hypothetical protein
MKGTPPTELGFMALQLLLAIAVIAFVFFRWQANRVRRGLGANADLSFLNPYTWLLRLTHRFKPCTCTTGALLLVPRTPLMRRVLTNYSRYRCGGCGKNLLLNETDAAFFEAARRKNRGLVV